jgi:hypothetical protein
MALVYALSRHICGKPAMADQPKGIAESGEGAYSSNRSNDISPKYIFLFVHCNIYYAAMQRKHGEE